MTPSALIFLTLSWTFVLGLTAWAFARVLRKPSPRDTGGASETPPPAR